MHDVQPVLTTPRLVLRPFVERDGSAVQTLAGVREVADTTLHIPHPYPDGAAEAWIATHVDAWEQRTDVIYAITRRETGALIGAIALKLDRVNNTADMGYWIGVPFWSQGYCTEAAAALVTMAFETLECVEVTGRHFTRNPASGRVMQKVGMTFVEVKLASMYRWDVWEDVVVYGVRRGAEPVV
jgi:[ribosomal protein S5]-alanine N-acetyltransferase